MLTRSEKERAVGANVSVMMDVGVVCTASSLKSLAVSRRIYNFKETCTRQFVLFRTLDMIPNWIMEF